MPKPSQSSKGGKLKVIAAIPCFNTENFIAGVVLEAKKYVDQVIVIDDGSDDGTAEAAKAAGALVISHGANRGYGEAIKSCFEAAKKHSADSLVILDGDGQHHPGEIPLVLAPILQGEADLVIGSRFIQAEKPQGNCPELAIDSLISRNPDSKNLPADYPVTTMPKYRSFGINVINLLSNLSSRVKVSDVQSGFRGYGAKALQGFLLSEQGMAISIETLLEAKRMNLRIKEVPITCSYPPSRLDIKAIEHGLGVALATLMLRFYYAVRRAYRRLKCRLFR